MMQPARFRHAPRATCGSLLVALGLAGCASLGERAPTGAMGIAGQWQLDAAHSDSFDGRVDQWLEAHRKRLREQRRRYGGEAGEMPADGGTEGEGRASSMGGAREVPPLMIGPEDPARERARMTEDLRPPRQLAITVGAGAIEMAGDDEPVRRLVPGERRSRIDATGPAEVDCGWENEAFVVRVRYARGGQRTWRYERERASGLLRVDFTDRDPEYGRLELHQRYRPADQSM